MKLVIFTDNSDSDYLKYSDSIAQITNEGLLNSIFIDQNNSSEDEYRSTITALPIDRCVKSKHKCPVMFNYYKVKKCPSVLFINDGAVVYTWEGKVPTNKELAQAIKDYLKILKLSVLDYNYDPDE